MSTNHPKQNKFMAYAFSEGGRRFEQERGYKFDIKNTAHMARVGDYWRALSDSQKQRYDHPTPRSTRHFPRKLDVPAAPKIDIGYCLRENIDDIRRNDRAMLEQIFRIEKHDSTRYGSNNRSSHIDTSFRILTVNPYRTGIDHFTSSIFCYPAEIGIASFTLDQGITAIESIIVQYDEHWFRGQCPREMWPHMCDISRQSNSAGICREHVQSSSARSPEETFQWLVNNCGNKTKIFVESSAVVTVLASIRTIVSYVGNEYATNFMKDLKVYTMPDILFALINSAGDRINDNDLLQLDHYCATQRISIRDEVNTLCDIHIRMRLDDDRRLFCAKAVCVRMAHVFFKVCRYRNIRGFNWDFEKHSLCDDIVGSSTNVDNNQNDYNEYSHHTTQSTVQQPQFGFGTSISRSIQASLIRPKMRLLDASQSAERKRELGILPPSNEYNYDIEDIVGLLKDL